MDIEQYYYFKVRNGKPYDIKVTIIHINTTINKLYVEMSNEQKAFYIEHTTASVMEVWNCEIVPPYVPPTPDLEAYIAQKVKELKDACYASVTITSLEYAMAEDKVNNLTADSYYTVLQANNVLKDFRSQSKKAMQVRDTYVPQIESALSIDAVDTLYNQAVEAL